MAPRPKLAAEPAPRRSWSLSKIAFYGALTAVALYGMDIWCAGGVNPHVNVNMAGKMVLITGGNTGIGFETARELARLGAAVVIAGRDAGRVGAAIAAIKREFPDSNVQPASLDLSDLSSVRSFSAAFLAEHRTLDVLINNAGVMIPPLTKTADGFELQIGTNHMGHFLLTKQLLPALSAAPGGSRVITVASRAHEHGSIDLQDLNWESRPYVAHVAYAQSKLANVLFARELAKREGRHGVMSFSLHPGVVQTELFRHLPIAERIIGLLRPFFSIFLKTPWEGAQTQLYLALAPAAELEGAQGAYFSDCAVKVSPNAQAHDDALAAALWEYSEKAVASKRAA